MAESLRKKIMRQMKLNTFCVSLHCSILPLSPLCLFCKIPISYSLASGGCDFGELWTTQKGLFVSLKYFISSQVGKHDGTRAETRLRETAQFPEGLFCLCPLRLSLSRITTRTYFIINVFRQHVSLSMTHCVSLERRHTPIFFFLQGNNSSLFFLFF